MAPIAFFSKGLTDHEQTFSTYDRELMAIFLAIKHFAYFLEGRKFTVLTDHQALTSALASTKTISDLRVIRQLTYISQFDCKIEHIRGVDNSVADALSRTVFSINEITPGIDYEAIAKSQLKCPELEELLNPSNQTSLEIKPVLIPGSDLTIWCDTSTGINRPVIPTEHRRMIFFKFHTPSHPGIRASQRLINRRVIWPNLKKDVRDWTRSCPACQMNKVHRHVHSPPGTLPSPSSRFEIIHIDIVGPLPESRKNRYLLTCIDRFSRWVEAIPM